MKYSKEILEPVIIESKSFSEVVRKLQNTEKVHGGMVAYIKKIAIENEIDFNHFTGRAWNKGLTGTAQNEMTIEKLFKFYLRKKPTKKTCNNNIKNWLFKLKVFEKQCALCPQNDVWNGLPLVLQLDHIDGDNTNNELKNLRILCPNCHSQTHNYAGRKNGRVA